MERLRRMKYKKLLFESDHIDPNKEGFVDEQLNRMNGIITAMAFYYGGVAHRFKDGVEYFLVQLPPDLIEKVSNGTMTVEVFTDEKTGNLVVNGLFDPKGRDPLKLKMEDYVKHDG